MALCGILALRSQAIANLFAPRNVLSRELIISLVARAQGSKAAPSPALLVESSSWRGKLTALRQSWLWVRFSVFEPTTNQHFPTVTVAGLPSRSQHQPQRMREGLAGTAAFTSNLL